MYQRGFGVAQRSLAEAFRSRYLAAHQFLVLPDLWQHVASLLLLLVVVGRFAVDLQETVELHHLALGDKRCRDVGCFQVEGVVSRQEFYLHRCLLQLCVGHLRGNGAFPYQVVEPLLLSRALNGGLVHIGGTDSLVRLLCPLRAGVVLAGLRVVGTVEVCNLLLRGSETERRQVHRVGTHIGDASALVEALCHHHCLADGEAQLAGGVLLQCRRGERGRRCALHRFLLNVLHGECSVLAGLQQLLHLLMRFQARGQRSLQLRLRTVVVLYAEDGVDAVVRLGLESLQFALALDDKPHGDTLHASCRQGRLHLAPQHGRHLEAYQTVEHAAGLLRVHQVHVQVARMLDGV